MSKSPVISVPLSRLITLLNEKRDWQGLSPAECGELAKQLGQLLDGAILFERFFLACGNAFTEASREFGPPVRRRIPDNVVDFPNRPDKGGAA